MSSSAESLPLRVLQCTSTSSDATWALAESLGRLLRPGDALGLGGKCRSLGAVPHERVARCLVAADVGLAPYDLSQYEPLRRFGFYWSPLKIFEYMAAGLPVVTIDADALRKIVEATGAGLCVEDSERALSDACADLLADGPARRAMGERGRRAVAERYNWGRHARDLHECLETVVEEKR